MGSENCELRTGSVLMSSSSGQFVEIHTLLDAIHGTWADRLGVTTPQLLIVFALRDFDNQGTGLRVKEVATLLSVDATFVTTQSKLLEANGLVNRSASSEDGRAVRLSLTDKSLKQLADLSTRQKNQRLYLLGIHRSGFANVCHEGVSGEK